MSVEQSTTSQRNTGFSIHLLTASGVLAGFFALEAVFGGRIHGALLWLVVCQILDGIDGPIARRFEVKVHAPHIDGHILDLVVDYVTCVVVPTVLLIKLQLVPDHLNTVIAASILVSSALWFARVDQETDDAWFRGFPAMWNIVVPSFIILDTSKGAVVAVCIIGCILQLSNVEFPHILRARTLRRATVMITTVYYSVFIVLSVFYPHGGRILKDILLLAPMYLSLIVMWRFFWPDREIFGQRIAEASVVRADG